MESKYPYDLEAAATALGAEGFEMVSDFIDKMRGPEHAPAHVLRDLVRHNAAKVTQIFYDARELCESEEDVFKVGAGIAGSCLIKFEGLCAMMLGEESWEKMPRWRQMQMAADCMYVLTEPSHPGEPSFYEALRRVIPLTLKVKFHGDSMTKEELGGYRLLERLVQEAVKKKFG